jgi:hypothetical protein
MKKNYKFEFSKKNQFDPNNVFLRKTFSATSYEAAVLKVQAYIQSCGVINNSKNIEYKLAN